MEKNFPTLSLKSNKKEIGLEKYLMASWTQTEYEEKTSVKTTTLILISQCI